MSEFRLKRPLQPFTDAWQHIPITPRRSTLLGISFRPLQAAAFGLDPTSTLRALLDYPFHLIRLGAYWNRMEPEPGKIIFDDLDQQIDFANEAGKQIILCVGPLKTFGYPEFFVPEYLMNHSFPEHTLIKPSAYPSLLKAATTFITNLVDRYKKHENIIAWQLEHDAVDPLGVEHSWRLDITFVEQEVEAIKKADPTRPLMMNGFLPTSLPVRFTQWWRTRDQGDSLAIARKLADMIGVDYYPRHAFVAVGDNTLYLDGSQSSRQHQREKHLLAEAYFKGQKVLISEGQAEPWETRTTPPNPENRWMYSCLPVHIISNYNTCMSWQGQQAALFAYLFWGAEYWLLRKRTGDPSYLQAFVRILENADNQDQ